MAGQMDAPGLAAIETEAVTLALTVIVIVLLVAVVGEAHAALLVKTTET